MQRVLPVPHGPIQPVPARRVPRYEPACDCAKNDVNASCNERGRSDAALRRHTGAVCCASGRLLLRAARQRVARGGCARGTAQRWRARVRSRQRQHRVIGAHHGRGPHWARVRAGCQGGGRHHHPHQRHQQGPPQGGTHAGRHARAGRGRARFRRPSACADEHAGRRCDNGCACAPISACPPTARPR